MSNEAIGLGFMPVDTASTLEGVDIESKFREYLLSAGITEEEAIVVFNEFDRSIDLFADIMRREKAVLGEMIAAGDFKKNEPPKEPAEKYDVLYVAKDLLYIEKEFAKSAVETYDALLRRIEALINDKPIYMRDCTKDDLILDLLSQLHRKYGGDRERFFSDADYRADRMKCIGSDALVYNDLIRLLGDS